MADVLMIPTYVLTSTGEVIGQNVIALKNIGVSLDQGAADFIASEWVIFWSDSCDAEVSIAAGIQFLSPFDDPVDEFIADNVETAGGSAGDLAPVNCAYLLRTYAGASRRRRGRIFLPGVDEAKVDNGGFLVGTTQDDIADNFNEFATNIATTADYLPGVWSRSDGVVRAVSAFAVAGQIGTQRRRMYALA